MIIIGYQGIGKSSLAKRNLKFIDLESGNFWVEGKRDSDWYKAYCNIAEHLSQQGYIVFTSSHEVVRQRLSESTEEVWICYPSLELKEYWINKLKDRYEQTRSEKDYKAYMNALDRYEDNIAELMNFFGNHLRIVNPEYDLEAMIIHHINKQHRGE